MMSITNENQILYEESPSKASSREKASRKSSKRKLNDAEGDSLNGDSTSSFVIFGRSVSISTFLDKLNTTPILLPSLSQRQKLKKHL